MDNENLKAAKAGKNDEFYTRYDDIQLEMEAYVRHDADVFLGKVVMLPCDNPVWSNFTRYFIANFRRLGLKKLVCTCYTPRGNGQLFELEDSAYHGAQLDTRLIRWDCLEGDGDFRSAEVRALLSEADIVVTNPPFSLFREFLAWLMKAGKRFIILGNMNAITYKEVFPHIMADRIWLGESIHGGDREFGVPDDYPLCAAGWREDAEKYDTAGRPKPYTRYIRVKGVRWFTNLPHGRRHAPLPLMTMAENLRYSRHREVRENGYRRYDNYLALEVPYTDAIPADYTGVMGVPVSFLDKYCPEQFELLGVTENNPALAPYQVPGCARYDRPYLDGQRKYPRLLIRRKEGGTEG